MNDHAMETMTQATTRLQALGYTGNWSAQRGGQLRCNDCDRQFDPEAVTVDEIVRFEGISDPGDEAILYALTGPCDHRGLYSSSYGPDATAEDVDVVGRLH